MSYFFNLTDYGQDYFEECMLVAATSRRHRRLLRARCEPRNNGLIFKGKSDIIHCSYGNTESLAGLLKPGLRKSQERFAMAKPTQKGQEKASRGLVSAAG